MSWGFGIRREEIEADISEAIHRILADYPNPSPDVGGALGLPIGNVFVPDQSDGPLPLRPYISFLVLSPFAQGRAGKLGSGDVRRYSIQEEWTVTVQAVVGNPQQITIKGVDYDHTAVGTDVTVTRDALLVLLAADPESTSVPVGANVIRVTSLAKGDRLKLTTSPAATLIARQTRQQILSRQTRAVQCTVQIRCFGFFDQDNPLAIHSGEHIAEVVTAGLLHPDIMIRMRGHCHIFKRILSQNAATGVFEQEVRSLGSADLQLMTEMRIDTTLPSTTAILGVVNQYSPFAATAPPTVP